MDGQIEERERQTPPFIYLQVIPRRGKVKFRGDGSLEPPQPLPVAAGGGGGGGGPLGHGLGTIHRGDAGI